MNVTQLNKTVNYQSTQFNGGYITYFKLMRQLIPMMSAQSKLMTSQSFGLINQFVVSLQIMWMWLVALVKLPWWLLIKPLGCCFKSVTKIKGSFFVEYHKHESNLQFSDFKFKKQKVTKTKIFYLIGVPFFVIPQKMTEDDWLKLIK